MSDVQRLGIQQVMKETLEYLTIKYKLLIYFNKYFSKLKI